MAVFEDRQMALAIAESIKKQFGKNSLNAGEFAKYLGMSRQFVCEKIKRRQLPGYKCGSAYSIPVNAIGLWEVRMAKTQQIFD